MRTINYLNGMQGVGAGNVATLDIPCNRRYHGLKLYVSGTFNAGTSFDPVELIASVRLLINGVVMRDLLPADVINIAKTNQITPATGNGELPFYFSEPWRASVIGEEATSWDLAGQTKATLEITFNSVSVTGSFAITNLACACEASFDYARNVDGGKPFLSIVKQLRYSVSAPSGNFDFVTLPTQYPIQRVHFRQSTGTAVSLEVWNGTVKVMEGLTAQLNTFYKDYKITGTFFALSAIFDFTQQISDALLPLPNNLNFRYNSSAANGLTAIVEHRAPGYV